MASLLPSRKKRLILDIGSSAIRVCELGRTKNGYQLTKYYQQEYSSDPALDEMGVRAARAKALEEVLKRSKIRHRKTVFAVPGQSVFTRTRALPPVPEYKVNQIVKYEIQQQIPFSLDQIAMDYQVLSRTEAGGYEVMMAAIKVEVVDKHIDIIQGARRGIDVVDVGPLAAYNWLKHTGEFGDSGECVALIDMGAATTDIVVERENQFRFTRPLNIGGNDITLALASAFGLNFGDAERLKRDRGFAPTGDPERDGKGGEVIGKILQRFTNEVMRSFAYFRSLPGGGQINRVVLCGGGACLRNIVPYLQRQLGVEVRIAQPLSGLAIGAGAQQASERPEQASVVLGLALRTLESVPIEINLVPPRVLEAARRKEQAFYWSLSLATLALIMASIIPDSANQNEAVKKRIETMKSFIHQYDAAIAARLTGPDVIVPNSEDRKRLQDAKGAIATHQTQVKVLSDARASRRFWLDEFSLLYEVRSGVNRMWFCSLESSAVAQGGNPQAAQGRPAPAARPAAGLAGLSGAGISRRSGGGSGATGVDKAKYPGFPGIEPLGPVAEGGPRGGGGLRAGGPGQQAAPGGLPQINLPTANAVIVNGYAETDEAINTFVNDLRTATRSLPNNEILRVAQVDFSEASVERVDPAILYDAPCGERVGGNQDAGLYNPENQQTMYSFSLVVVFQRGENAPAAPAAPTPPNQPGNPPPNAPN